jgi:hypothetical protein
MGGPAEAGKHHQREAISPLANISYNRWNGETDLLNPIESPADPPIQDFLRQFALARPGERKGFRAGMSMDDFHTLFIFSSRMAVFALRSGNADQLQLGFTAMAPIDAARSDSRDILIRLSLLNHTAGRIRPDTNSFFESALRLAPRQGAKIIKEFHRRSEAQKSLHAFGFKEVVTANGAGFASCSHGPYSPTIDPLQLLIGIAAILRADRYAPSISLASRPGPAWFRPGSPEEEHRRNLILDGIHAVSLVKGRLRPEHHKRADAQSFHVFLLECAAEEDAAFLARLAASRKTDAHVALPHGRILCLIAARSYVGDVESYESSESIQRFREPIDRLLQTALGNP